MKFSLELIEAVNEVARFLAFESDPPDRADLIVVLGSALVDNAYRGSIMYKNCVSERILVCGGIGHSTTFLYDAIHSQFGVDSRDQSEAEIFAEIMVSRFDVPKRALILETESTNCGSNAIKAKETLDALNLQPQSIAIIQDPTMQRRSIASFEKAYEHHPDITFYSCPPFVPELTEDGAVLGGRFSKWTTERIIELILGEIPRFAQYGPNGTGFIPHVEVPQKIQESWNLVAKSFPELIRK